MNTRRVPASGLPTWSEPDPAAPTGPDLPGALDVEVITEFDDGWTRVRCSNGWEAWVDGRLLLPAGTMVEPAGVAARAPKVSPKVVYGALAAVAAVVIGFVLLSGGDSDDGGTIAQTGGSTSGSSARAFNDFDDATIKEAIAAADALPASQLAPSSTDEDAAKRISDAMKTAGFDLGPGVLVMPLGPETNMLYLSIDESHPLNTLPEAQSQKFLETLASAPVMAETKVTRLLIDLGGTDTKGPYTASLTVTLADLLDQIRNKADISKRVAFELVRK